MKIKNYSAFFTVRSLLLFCMLFASVRLNAQQNLFNVPSGNITEKGDIFFQQQFNLARPVGSSNTTLDYGLTEDFEVGINFLDLILYDDTLPLPPGSQKQDNPDLLFNFQRGFTISEYWEIGAGAQLGFNPSRRPREVRFQDFIWMVNAFKHPEHEKLGTYYVGPYYANVAYAGAGHPVGCLLGVEIPLIEDKLSLQADALTGNSDISVAVLGGVYTFRSGWQLSLGAQTPMPQAESPKALVIELTYPGRTQAKKNRLCF